MLESLESPLLLNCWCTWAHVQNSCHNHRDRKLLLSFKWKMRFSHGHFISRREALMKTPVRTSFMTNTGNAIGLFKTHEPQKKPGKICLVSDFIEACSSALVCPRVHWSSAFQVILIRFMFFFLNHIKLGVLHGFDMSQVELSRSNSVLIWDFESV